MISDRHDELLRFAKMLEYNDFVNTHELDSYTFKEVIDDPFEAFELGYDTRHNFDFHDDYFRYDRWAGTITSLDSHELESDLDYYELDILLESLDDSWLRDDAMNYIENYNIDDDRINDKIKEFSTTMSEERTI